jgi:hypothetical protein
MGLARSGGLRLRGHAGPGKDKFSAALTAPGADVDEMISGTDHGLLVFHDDEGVAEITETLHHPDELANIARVQTDGRLVEDKESVCQARAETGRQVNPLGLST